MGHAQYASHEALKAQLDAVAVVPYGIYYLNYRAAGAVQDLGSHFGAPGRFAAQGINSALFVPGQVAGLAGDAGLDVAKSYLLQSNESASDEGHFGYLNPWHSFLPSYLRGPEVYLPGIHSNGQIDIVP